MQRFTKDSTFGDMFTCPEFSEYVPYMISFFPPTDEKGCSMKFSAMREGAGIGVANALNRLCELTVSGEKVMHHIYSDEYTPYGLNPKSP